MTLSAGQLAGGALTPGSMAADIEAALEGEVPLGANEDPTGRQKLALAIARGVLKHLRDNASSVHVTVPDTVGTTHQQQVTIDIDGSGL